MLKLPSSLRLLIILLLIIIFIIALITLRFLLVPLSFAALISILIVPFTERQIKWGVPESFAIIINIFLMGIILAVLIWLFTNQIRYFIDDLPNLQSQIDDKLLHLQTFIQKKTHLKPAEQISWLQNNVYNWFLHGSNFVNSTISFTTSTLEGILLLPFYIFFMVFYRKKFSVFIFRISHPDRHYPIQKMVADIQKIVQSYLQGVFIVILILTVLNTIVLKSTGIKYALFIGALAALLNVIPYVGMLIGNLLATGVAFLTKDSLWYPLIVTSCFWGIHWLESNILTPKITGSSVKINPLVAFLALLIGSKLWGLAGMFLFIPLVGILKVVFDNIPQMEPYGYLLGSEKIKVPTKKGNGIHFSLKDVYRKGKKKKD